jgi:hypothetical protein
MMFLISLQGAQVLSEDFSADVGAESIRALSADTIADVSGGDCTGNYCTGNSCGGNICLGDACVGYACGGDACVGFICGGVVCFPKFAESNQLGGGGGG